MNYKQLCEVYSELESTSKRLEMRDIIAELLRKVHGDELRYTIYITVGRLGPRYDSLVLGIRERLALKILSSINGVPIEVLQNKFNEIGDIGDLVTQIDKQGSQGSLDNFFDESPPDSVELTVSQIWESLVDLSQTEGSGSESDKISILRKILTKLTTEEQKYYLRLLVGKLRFGVQESTFIDATAELVKDKIDKQFIERIFHITSDIGSTIQLVLDASDMDSLTPFLKPKIGTPIQVMTAQRGSSGEEIMGRMGGISVVEQKFDGYRVQIHKSDNNVTIWSRNQEKYNDQFPDVIQHLIENYPNLSFIIEGELVAYDYESGQILNFQILTNRRRKHNIDEAIKEIKVHVFLFDLIYINGTSYIDEPLSVRRQTLEKYISNSKLLSLATQIQVSTAEEIDEQLLLSKEDKSEGIMVKSLSSSAVYEPGKRSFYWIKYKIDYVEGLLDTFDLVIVGGFHGKGKRANTYGTLLMAAYDEITEKYYTFCRLGAGLTDENLATITQQMEELRLTSKPTNLVSTFNADIWVKPKIILEVSAAEITESPRHTVFDQNGGGLALRFPRFTGKIRDDKSVPEDVTQVSEILEIRETLSIGSRKR